MQTSWHPRRPLEDRLAAVSCVLFDLDGTLIDSIGLILSSFRHATGQVLGRAVPDELFLSNVGQPLRQQMAVLAPDHADELLREYRAHNEALHDDVITAFPGATETLAALAEQGLVLGVVTSKTAGLARRGLEHTRLAEHMAVVIGADDVGRHKPDPLPLIEAAGRLGVSALNCAYVGDSPFDVEAANAAGAVSVGALWGAFGEDRLREARPDVLLNDISELKVLLGCA